MRIGLNGYFLGLSETGSGQYTSNLLYELRELGVAVDVIGPPSAGNLRKLWFEHVEVPKAALSRGVDVLHVPYLGPPLFRLRPTVVTVHDLILLVLPEHRGSWQVRLYTKLALMAVRFADLVIADSECTRQDLVRWAGIPSDKIRVIYLGVERRFRPVVDQGALAAMRNRYGLDERYIFYIGGLDWRKNVVTLLRAYAALENAPVLAIAGKPHSSDRGLYPDLPALARELGIEERVRFLGRVPEEDKPLLYAGASLFVFPSRYEGFGLTPLEAMACGTPVICSRAASLPEVVGDAAILFDPTDVHGLVEAMNAVLSDRTLAAELRHRGIKRASRFSWRRTAEETLAAYRAVHLPK